jgi:DNA topoisomerase-1
MSKYLVVIESPGKLKSYRKYLGPDYEIVASVGHVMDLPPKGGLGVNIKKQFEPTFEVMDDKKQVLSDIVKKAKKSKLTYLMMDPDREGTGIAAMIASQFPKSVKYTRAATSSITKKDIEEAISNSGDIDQKMYDAFLARRILDRIAGFKTSFLVKQATGGRSAGRVQSAALRILAEREKEIAEFKPQEFWPVDADLKTTRNDIVTAHVIEPDKMDTKTEDDAKEVVGVIEKGPVKVEKYDVKEVSRRPQPPFITSSLQATASSMLGWNQKKTMGVAQKLYEAGHITYMRTDSAYIVPDKVKEIRSAIEDRWNKKFLPDKENAFKKGKNAQEAHECIRPTDLNIETAGSVGDEAKLYKMIWKRTIASQMLPEKREQVRAVFKAGKVRLAASGSRQTFEGWKACWDYRDASDTFLPEMKVGEKVTVEDVRYEQKFTEPPPRYGVASFNSKLEEVGLGRPSTLAAIIDTLRAREYIENDSKTHKVTDLGMRVTDFLVKNNFCFADVKFTREMEDKLDSVLEGKTQKLDILNDFWTRLKSDIASAKENKDKLSRTEYPCPLCKKANREKFLQRKFSSFGEFYACEARTDKEIKCDYKADVGDSGEPKEKPKKEPPKKSGIDCPECGGDLVIRSGKFGEFLGCNKFPKCRVTADMEGNIKKPSKGKGKKFYKKSNK